MDTMIDSNSNAVTQQASSRVLRIIGRTVLFITKCLFKLVKVMMRVLLRVLRFTISFALLIIVSGFEAERCSCHCEHKKKFRF